MICPECRGEGENIYYEEIDRDEHTVTVAGKKEVCKTCKGSGKKPVTNADRIRAMNDDELIRFCLSLNLDGWAFACQHKPECNPYPDDPSSCNKCLAEWFKQEAKEGE